MDHNDALPTRKQGNKIRSFRFIAVIAVILLPTIIALVAFALISDGFDFGAEKSLYEIKLYDTEGNLIDEDIAYPDEAKEGSVVALFSPITAGFSETTELPEDLNREVFFRALITYDGFTDEYVFYLSTTDDVGYCTVNQKKHYRLTDINVHSILSSKYAEIFYKTAVPPTLYSSSGDKIIPESVSWKYKVASGEYLKSGSYDISDGIMEYVMSGAFSLQFSVEPDICVITVSQNGSEIYSGNYSDMPELNIDKSKYLDVTVESEWSQKDGESYHGRTNYTFRASIVDKPDFELIGNPSEVNSFFMIRATNIEDLTRLKVSTTPNIPYNIKFIKSGDFAVALVPVSSRMRGNDYDVTVSYGAISESFSLSISSKSSERNFVDSSATIEEYYETRSSRALQEIEDLKMLSGSASATDRLFGSSFLDYTDVGATLYANFNDYYSIEGLGNYSAIGTEYRFEGKIGAGVPVMNSGQVIKAGYDVRLGNYVIVSHGMGITTWYTHLSIIDAEEGQYVAKGEIVGKTGSSGLTGDDNVTVIATVKGEFIDVKHLIGKEF